MNKEQQDLAWACLPKEARDEIKQLHFHFSNTVNKTVVREFENIFGRDNITSDTEPEEMLMVSRSEVQDRFNTFNNPNWASNEEEAYGAQLVIDTLDLLFGDKCLPDKEGIDLNELNKKLDEALEKETSESLNEWIDKQQSVQGESKFKVGDKVKIKGVAGYDVIEGISLDGYILSGETEPYLDTDLEPYTEPETKDNINMEQKELNLCELLIDYEYTGAMFYFALAGREFELLEIKSTSIYIKDPLNPHADTEVLFYNGKMYYDGIAVLFPTKELYEKYPLDAYSAWMEWKSERTPKRWRAKQGETYWYFDRSFVPHQCTADANSDFDRVNYENGNMFPTEELAYQAAEAVRECLMKFHENNIQK